MEKGTPTWKHIVKLIYSVILLWKFLDAGIQDVSTSISIVHDLIEMSDDDGDESDKHI